MSRGKEELLALFERLGPAERETLLAFAESLAARAPAAAAPPEAPARERPAEETVVMAIRRLVRTYPMLDRRQLLAEASHFMAQHALEGRAAREVIDELEQVFARHYGKSRAQGGS